MAETEMMLLAQISKTEWSFVVFELVAHLLARMKSNKLHWKITVCGAQTHLIADHSNQNPDSSIKIEITRVVKHGFNVFALSNCRAVPLLFEFLKQPF